MVKNTKFCFNTSYVSVQDLEIKQVGGFKKFQYILCVGSSRFKGMERYTDYCVSIHLMCRFKDCIISLSLIVC